MMSMRHEEGMVGDVDETYRRNGDDVDETYRGNG